MKRYVQIDILYFMEIRKQYVLYTPSKSEHRKKQKFLWLILFLFSKKETSFGLAKNSVFSPI